MAGENYPKHVGVPIAEDPNTFYKLEVHFDNPAMKSVVGTSGLRMHYTDRLREHEGAILVTGVALSPLHIIPPEQQEYRSAGYCSIGCTKKVFPIKTAGNERTRTKCVCRQIADVPERRDQRRVRAAAFASGWPEAETQTHQGRKGTAATCPGV